MGQKQANSERFCETWVRMLEQQVKPLGITYKTALDEISSTKAAILELGDKTFLAPPKYRPLMQQILHSMELDDK